jgi:hypothetical protein
MANFNVMDYLKNRQKEEAQKLAADLRTSEEQKMMNDISRQETEMELTMRFGGAY